MGSIERDESPENPPSSCVPRAPTPPSLQVDLEGDWRR